MSATDHEGRRDELHDDECTRASCQRLLIARLGKVGMKMFLRQQQPDLGDRTGAELLETDPDELLRQLNAFEV